METHLSAICAPAPLFCSFAKLSASRRVFPRPRGHSRFVAPTFYLFPLVDIHLSGHIFSFPAHLTWEWTNEKPIRSIFPIWLVYGWPLTILQWIWGGLAHSHVSPAVVFYTLRTVMVTTSFVLEDWALHELLPVPKQHRTATLLVASSYVTWTYQSHTFSNSIETLLVLWCLVLARRIREDRTRSQVLISFVLAFLCVLGVFNRITFPAFVVIPLLQLLPHFRRK